MRRDELGALVGDMDLRIGEIERQARLLRVDVGRLRLVERDGLADAGREDAVPVARADAETGARPAPQPAAAPATGTAAAAARIRDAAGRGIDIGDLLAGLGSSRGMAWVGGLVTLLGIVFFYVVANDRGWIGPGGRVALGFAVSSVLVAVAVWLRDRLAPQTAPALAAAGAGIAGLYASLFAATALYDFVPAAAGLPGAVAVAALAVAIALRWSAQSLAALGLLGALAAPVLVNAGVDPLGTAFATVVVGATAALWLARGWTAQAVAGSVGGALQALALVAVHDDPTALGWTAYWQAALVVVAFCALHLGAAYAARLRAVPDPHRLALGAVTGVVGLAVGGVAAMADDAALGEAYVGLAAALAAIAAGWALARRRDEDIVTTLAAGALTAAFVATAALLGGNARTAAFGAEAILMAALAVRLRVRRLQAAAVVYGGATALWALAGTASPEHLVEFGHADWSRNGGLDLAAVAGGVLGVATFAATAAILARGALALVWPAQRWRAAAAWLAGGAALYAASLVALAPPLLVDYTARSFQNGHTLVSAVWGAAGLALVTFGLLRRRPELRHGGLLLLAGTLAKLFLFDLATLNLMARAVSFLAVGLVLLAGAVAYARLAEERDGDENGHAVA